MTIMTPNGKFGLIKLHGMVSSPSPLQLAVAAGNFGMVKDITELSTLRLPQRTSSSHL